MANENVRTKNPTSRHHDVRRQEAEDTLHAIRQGSVDAFVVEEPEGHRVYTLEHADLPYSNLVERMQQGAAMLDEHGCFLYANLGLSELLGKSRESLIGLPLKNFVPESNHLFCQKLVDESRQGSSEGELQLLCGNGRECSAHLAFKVLSQNKWAVGVLITDLTTRNQQRDVSARLQQMQDDERRRIARELHDSVGQLLVAIAMNLSVVQGQAHKLDNIAARAVIENVNLVEQVSREIRTVSYLLHPPLLDVAGLISALRLYVDGFSSRSPIKVELEAPADFPRLADALEITVFRIVQESLTNVHRHSGSPTARISLRFTKDQVEVEVADQGKGLRADQWELAGSNRSGVGFAGMKERLDQLGGKLSVKSDASGTTVRATLPLELAEIQLTA